MPVCHRKFGQILTDTTEQVQGTEDEGVEKGSNLSGRSNRSNSLAQSDGKHAKDHDDQPGVEGKDRVTDETNGPIEAQVEDYCKKEQVLASPISLIQIKDMNLLVPDNKM